MQIGGKLGKFLDFCGDRGLLYLSGMELFTGVSPKKAEEFHVEIIHFRNYIDHFHFYADHSKSILELYSEIYNKFFSYSYNFKKSCSYIMKNILAEYFVDADFDFVHGGEATFSLRSMNEYSEKRKSLISMKHTYLLEKKKININARSDSFLHDIYKILNYKVDKKE